MLKSTSFIFDGVPSETYGLMIYFTSDEEMKELSLGTDVDMIEDRLPKRVSPIHYGVDMNKSMTFPLTFGSTEYLEDYDVDAILSWLTGHQQYKWLEFVDGDHYVRYKCHLNNMKSVYINGLPVAFTCDVECDGQFAYEYPTSYQYDIDNTEALIEFFNKSSYNGYLYPKMTINFGDDCNSFSIINESDNDREFKINYFDRAITDTTSNELIEDTTLAEKISESEEQNEDFISWSPITIPTSFDYGEIIEGENAWVALPSNGNVALYSLDMGETWEQASPTLPFEGEWTGCYGESGFVAVCKDTNTAIASYSQTGMSWTQTIIELPFEQDWNGVAYVETTGFMPNQYVAFGGVNSNIIAVSATGWAWSTVGVPITQDWRDLIVGDGKAILIGGNTNQAVISTDCISWRAIELPRTAAWSAGCYGTNGYIMLADTLYGSGSRNPIALKSSDGESWDVIEFPIGSWSDITYGNSQYMAIGERQFAYSFDGNTWNTSTLPISAKKIYYMANTFICSLGTNKYMTSNSASTAKGSFTLALDVADDYEIQDIYVTATISNDVSDTSYASNGDKLLASNVEATETEDAEITGGELVAVTTDLRYGFGIDGVMMSAVFDIDTRTATINFVADKNHTEVLNAPLEISIQYKEISSTDLGYNGLVVDFDNENQIITTNKETLNMYEYFNKKFFRLVKGLNKLKIKTDAGTCKLTINCEFLRKVGGR